MRCTECGADFDELNESQPVCPGCGTPPGPAGDDADVAAVLDDAGLIDVLESTDEPDLGPEDPLGNPVPASPDLDIVRDDAEALLLATGNAGFDVPGKGYRILPLPTDRVM
jgi:hypothetical protein